MCEGDFSRTLFSPNPPTHRPMIYRPMKEGTAEEAQPSSLVVVVNERPLLNHSTPLFPPLSPLCGTFGKMDPQPTTTEVKSHGGRDGGERGFSTSITPRDYSLEVKAPRQKIALEREKRLNSDPPTATGIRPKRGHQQSAAVPEKESFPPRRLSCSSLPCKPS